MDIIKGKTWTFGKNIDTDVIIPGRYLRTFNPQDLADHVLEGERPDFTKNVKNDKLILLKFIIFSGGKYEKVNYYRRKRTAWTCN